MSKRRRERTPISENTLINSIASSRVRFIEGDSTVVNELFEDVSGEDENEYEPVDDKDEDPDFVPEENVAVHEKDENEDDPEPQPSTSSGSPGPRGESNAAAGWKIFSKENNLGNETVHESFEQPGPRHGPPNNARPVDYFNLFFTQTLLTTFVTWTNLYASNYIQNLTPFSLRPGTYGPGKRPSEFCPGSE
ncbi:hypothetical protein J6590_086401 [Homalodisca vitripennis]|nr:hypothetical protein J6590_086401 [Homalodisca vitripennis]